MMQWLWCILLASIRLMHVTGNDHHPMLETVESFEQSVQYDSHAAGPTRGSLQARSDAIERSRRLVENHNAQYEAGRASYYMRLNAMGDLSSDEYNQFLKSRPSHVSKRQLEDFSLIGNSVDIHAGTVNGSVKIESMDDLPKEVDWRKIQDGKYLSPIKNQGTCGSCWAFAGVSVVESHYAIQEDVQAQPLSVEQVLSCSAQLDHIRSKPALNVKTSSSGCEGGMAFLTYEYMKRMDPYGIVCASTYPYIMATDVFETECHVPSADQTAVQWEHNKSDYEVVQRYSEAALMRALVKGPVSTNIDSESDGFRLYGGGIYDAKDCASDGDEINHAVVLVGYGETDKGEKYWVLRNTWGPMWGEDGYFRMVRGAPYLTKNGPCNLYKYSTYPINLQRGGGGEEMCADAVDADAFVKLGTLRLISFGIIQWVILVGTSVVVLIAGITYVFFAEESRKKRVKTGDLTRRELMKMWQLPTREQVAVHLAQRRPKPPA